MRIGLISDTHGLMREAALEALRGSDLILHAGDIGSAAILEALQALAPVVAIRGNNDTDAWARHLPETRLESVAGQRIMLIHDLKTLDVGVYAQSLNAVICGHSHKPEIRAQGGVLIVNPGSAGPRRFRLPITVARLNLDGARTEAQILPLG